MVDVMHEKVTHMDFGYPRFSRRLQALMIDSVVVGVAAMLTLVISSKFGLKGGYSAASAVLAIFALEPWLVAFTGGTLGHHIAGIRVANRGTGKNINIFAAVIRFLAKIVLGTLSLVSIFVTKQHQAIHDQLVGSVVVLKNVSAMLPHEVLAERVVEEEGYKYPSKIRRIIALLIYNVASIVVLGLASTVFVSDGCALQGFCSQLERALSGALSVLWLIFFVGSVVLCWRAQILGCRKRVVQNA